MEEPSLDLAKRLSGMGISDSYASQLARGIRTPSLPLALKIHKVLGVNLGPMRGVHPDDVAALERLAERKAG